MAGNETKWDKMIIGIIKATNKNNLIWNINKFSNDIYDNDVHFDVFYSTQYEDNQIRLYEKRYKDYRGPSLFASSSFSIINSASKSFEPDPNEKIWHSRICLDLVNKEGIVSFQITNAEPLVELLDIVKEKASGINKLKEEFERY